MTQEALEKKFNKAFTEVVSTNSNGNNFLITVLYPTMCKMLERCMSVFSYSFPIKMKEYEFSTGDIEEEECLKEPFGDTLLGGYGLETARNYYETKKSVYSKPLQEELDKIHNIIPNNTLRNIIEYLKSKNIPFIKRINYGSIYVVLEDMLIYSSGFYSNMTNTIYFVSDKIEIPDWVCECAEFYTPNKKNTFKYVVHTQRGFTTTYMDIKKMDVNLEENYNDDLPYEQIEAFINSNEAGISIFHGEPGTGKTTFIRHLVSKHDKKDFLYVDASCFNYITDASFIQLLTSYNNSVLILEDCEKLLKNRENSHANMATLLNMTDGMLADSLKLKIICTFNAPLENIDKALLRKGRLKIKYNFGKLEKEKTAKLLAKLGVEDIKPEAMTLADIFNYTEQVDFGTKKKKSVGF